MGVIYTVKADCLDCYKCVRFCPVKAIKVIDGHAKVVDERCLGDGHCVLICPQKAKKVVSGKDAVRQFLKEEKVVITLAPSFVAIDGWLEAGKLKTALHKLGFAEVTETAEGAHWVAQEHLKLLTSNTPLITSCCPVAVNLIEKYFPQFIKYLAPLVSPMIAHGLILKDRYASDVKVVFAGPCVGKKEEYMRPELAGAIDAVITFNELEELLAENNIDVEKQEKEEFSQAGEKARVFPTPGGLAKTAQLSTDLLAREIVTIDGLEDIIEFLEGLEENVDSLRLIELLACRGGCLMGPGLENDLSLFKRRERLLSYAQTDQEEPLEIKALPENLNLSTSYGEKTLKTEMPSEVEIKRILAMTGKVNKEDELNCGACGYNSCREKAIAVYEGMAEVEMCIPYMRSKAESRANLICGVTPNAIFVVDSDLNILEVNPAAEIRFRCQQEELIGKGLSTLIDTNLFQRALETKNLVTGEVAYPEYGITTWQAIFYVEQEDVVIGIFADITREKEQRDKLALVTAETLEKAQEVIDKQMRVAQEIAGLLGETTAETKVLLTKLIKQINVDGSER